MTEFNKLDRTPLGGTTPNAAEVARQRAEADRRALAERNARIADIAAGRRPGAPPQPEQSDVTVPTVGDHMANMTDADLASLVTTDMLPQVHTPTSADYLAVANAKAARTELFKRALKTPMVIAPGKAP